jgi:hypothetical protein
VKKVEQRSGANGILPAHGGFYLAMPRVFVTGFQLGAGFCQFSKKRHLVISQLAILGPFCGPIRHMFLYPSI